MKDIEERTLEGINGDRPSISVMERTVLSDAPRTYSVNLGADKHSPWYRFPFPQLGYDIS